MHNITLDFSNPGLPQVIDVMQSDAQSRFIGITLYDGGVPYSAPSGAQYTVQYRGSGANNMGWYDTIQLSSGTRKAVVVSSSSPNVVTLELAEQALRVNGKVEVSLCVVNNTGYKLNTFPIICRVTGAPYVDPVAVRSYFYVIGITSEQWLAYVTACQDAQKRAEDAAATFETDPTLTLSGKAADAKATGEIKEDLDDFAPKVWAKNITDELSFEVGYYDPIQNTIIKNESYLHAVVKASKGDVFFYDGDSTYDGRLYALVKDNAVLKYYPDNADNADYLVGNKIEINTDCDLYLNTNTSKLCRTILYKISNNTNVEILDGNTYNIFDASRLKDGLIGTTYGSLFHFEDDNRFLHLPYVVKCKKGDIIRAKFKWYGLIFLDDYFKVVNSATTSNNYAFEISDETVHYVSVYVGKENSNAYQVITINHDIPNYYVPYGVNQLDSEAQMRRNLKWCALGDSITDANTLKNDSHGNKNYVDFVKKSLEVNAINNGVGGTGYIANNGGASKTFIQRIDDIPSDAELITVFGSFNDVYQGFELGTINDDKAKNTLYGKLKEFYETLFAKRPDAIVGLITPTPWETCCRYNTSSDKYQSTVQYITALLDIAKLYSIPVLNMFDESDMRPYDSVFKKSYYRDNNDNVHPNQKGHEKYISPKIVDFIRKITMYD